MFQLKVVRNWILYQKVRERISLSPPVVELVGSNIAIFEILNIPKMAKLIHFRAHAAKNTYYLNFIRESQCKSVRGYVYPPPFRVDVGSSKHCHFWNVRTKNGKVYSLYCSTMLKIRIISNKSCKLNFVERSQWAHMSISPRSGATGSKQCHFWNKCTKK